MACQEWLKKTNGIESNVISENLSSEEAIIIVQNWYILGNQAPVMIISDKAPFDSPLDLSHLDLVIHYDYPDSKLHFADRFLHLKKCVTSIYDETKSEEKIENCYLLAGPEDCDKIKTIRTLLLRTKSFIPNDLNKVTSGHHWGRACVRCLDPCPCAPTPYVASSRCSPSSPPPSCTPAPAPPGQGRR